MPGILDSLFPAKKVLDTVAKGPAPAPAPAPPTQSDSAAMAQRNADYAAKRLASQKQAASPLSTPMTPIKKGGK